METSTRRKSCIVCGERFSFKRSRPLQTCSKRCAKRLERAGKPPKLPGDDRLVPFQPRSLSWATLALEKGMKLEHLVLSDVERAALVASCPLFPTERRLEAASQLLRACAPWAWKRSKEIKLKLGRLQLEWLVLAALEAAKDETKSFPNTILGRKGRPREVAPYVPADDIWPMLLHDFLPRELGRLFRLAKNDPVDADHVAGKDSQDAWSLSSLRLEGPAGADKEGKPRTLDEVLGVTPDGEIVWKKQRGAGFTKYTQALSRPSDPYKASREPEEVSPRERAEWLKRWAEANPDLNRWELSALRTELNEAWRVPLPVHIANIESEARKAARIAWDAGRVDELIEPLENDDEIGDWSDEAVTGTTTMPAEELRERLIRMECKLNEVLDGLPDLCERLRDRWPEHEKLGDAINTFLEEM